MLTMTPVAREASKHSIPVRSIVELYYGSSLTATLPVVQGSVAADSGASPMRTCTLTVAADPRLLPTVTPWGYEARPYVGIRLPDGTWEQWCLGVYRVNGVNSERYGQVELSLSDRSAGVADDRFLYPTSIAGSAVAAITTLVRDAYPGVTVTADAGIDRTIEAAIYEESRWEAVLAISRAIGAWTYFDTTGNLRIRSQTGAVPPASWTIAEGETGTLVSYPVNQDREGIYNAVVASGESTDELVPPVSAVVYDNNAASPTKWGGPFGKVPRFYVSSLLTTVGQCQLAAQSILATSLARYEQTQITAVPCWALEPGDVLTVVARGQVRSHVIDSINWPLGRGSMTLTPRATPVAVVQATVEEADVA